jgi:hypothetical protein
MNTLVWSLVIGVVTAIVLRVGKVKPNFWTGIACGIAFCAGIASQQIQLF